MHRFFVGASVREVDQAWTNTYLSLRGTAIRAVNEMIAIPEIRGHCANIITAVVVIEVFSSLQPFSVVHAALRQATILVRRVELTSDRPAWAT